MAQTDDDWQPSVEESLRRLQDDTAATEAGNNAANTALMRQQPRSQNSGSGDMMKNIANGINGADWGGGFAGTGIGGAGQAVGGGMFGGAAGAADGAAYAGGAAPSTVLPGILPGATGVSGASAGAEGIFGGGVAGGSAAGAGASGAASSGFGGAVAAGGPWAALAAAILGHNQWAKGQGLRNNESFPLETGLEGRALYKDSGRYQEWGNRAVDGLGDEWRLAGLGSSPADLFNKNTWSEAAKIAASGGILGKAIKKLF